MQKYFIFFYLGVLTVLLAACASTTPIQMNEPQLEYTYSKLKLLDLDQMRKVMQNKLQNYQKNRSDWQLLDIVQICLSRPNEDGLLEKIIESARLAADSEEKWEQALVAAAEQAIEALSDKMTAGEDQVTYLILLENLTLELRPEFVKQYESPQFETRLIEKIAQANIRVSKVAANESQLNLMRIQKSPSQIAQFLIREKATKLKFRLNSEQKSQ